MERLIVTKMFDDASSKLVNSDTVFKAAGDRQRSAKIGTMLELIALLSAYEARFAAKDYSGAVGKLENAVVVLRGVVDMEPVTLMVPQALSRNGQCGPHAPSQIVRCRALQVGMADRDAAAAALTLELQSPGTEAGSKYYDECRAALAEARRSFEWTNRQRDADRSVAEYQVVGIVAAEVRKMQEIERAGAEAQAEVDELAARCEREVRSFNNKKLASRPSIHHVHFDADRSRCFVGSTRKEYCLSQSHGTLPFAASNITLIYVCLLALGN